MTTYKVSRQGLLDMRRRMVLLAIVVTVLSLILACLPSLPSWLTFLDRSNANEPGAWAVIASRNVPSLAAALLVLCLLWWIWRRQIDQQQVNLSSIEIELGEDYVARRQLRVSEIRIDRKEITRMQETGSVLCVYTADKFHSLAVPRSLDDYDHVRAVLSTWAPIKPPDRHALGINLIVAAATLLGMGIILFSFEPWLVVAASGMLIGYFGYNYWLLGRHEGVDPRFRRGFLFFIGWVLFFDLLKVFLFVLTSSRAQ